MVAHWFKRGVVSAGIATAVLTGAAYAAPIVVASYGFEGSSLASSTAGAPDLVAVNSGFFTTATVYGHSRTVYQWNGTASPVTSQAGLSLDTSTLGMTANSYSLEMVFNFSQGQNAWRRILDVQNRASDSGFYVAPSNQLSIYPVVTGSSAFNSDGTFHYVALIDNSGMVAAYLDGVLQFNVATSVMDNNLNLFNFFLDNIGGSANNEFSNGQIAGIRLWNGAMSADEIALTARDPFAGGGGGQTPVPEPASLAIFGLGLAGLGIWRRKR